MVRKPSDPRALPPALVFVLIFLGLFLLHIPLLRLPYFWDEAGYYIPAARDLWLAGELVPHSTPSNAHPPLVMAYLALWWKTVGFSPVVTRTAMLLVAAFSLLGIFRLARRVANSEVAVASTICCALYPVFFTQSTLAHLDLAAAGLIFWGLLAYVEERWTAAAWWFSVAVLAKETALLVPLGLLAWEALRPLVRGKFANESPTLPRHGWKPLLLLLPALPLGVWYGYHYLRTGLVFGNPEFFRYNVRATLHPLRMLIVLVMRVWQTVGYMNLFLLAVAALLAMWRGPLQDLAMGSAGGEVRSTAGGTLRLRSGQAPVLRPRIAVDIQFGFLVLAVVYGLAMSVVGGAVLARYMLPIVPLVIIVSVSTLWRRVPMWRYVIGIVVLGFVSALFINPPYGFSFEDNLAYRDYVRLHMNAARFVEARYPMARVLTAWPANDELAQPTLGYVTRPMRTLRIESFTVQELMSAAEMRSSFSVALVFSTKYQPPHPWLENWPAWRRIKERFFGYHRDVPPEAAAQILGGQVVFSERRNEQWVGVVEIQRTVEASVRPATITWVLRCAQDDS